MHNKGQKRNDILTKVLLKGKEVALRGGFLKIGNLAPDFALVAKDLENKTLESFKGKKKVIATVPSIDTGVCAAETRELNLLALEFPSVLFLIVSKDLPFAFDRFCKQGNLHNIITLSDIRSQSNFAKDYGVGIVSGPLDGLLARSIIFLDEFDKVLHSELSLEITSMPNFDSLRTSLQNAR